ncbi:energy transducer TonB [uncultured Microscilla sp.]|uniref:energy transducer TonB n=1 Tax=uncultured Microscilla sp. TaxID=432653 RepID=UPI00260453A9|nr:energy transducer TonB [uncultured Microscilla sp.]
MELKKNPSADIGRNKLLFFSIGLAVTMLFIVVSFEWRVYDSITKVEFKDDGEDFEEQIEIPITEMPPPPPPVLQQPEVIEVPDEEKIDEEIEVNLDVEFKEEAPPPPPVKVDLPPPPPPVVEKEEKIFMIVEDQAMPKGGLKKFYKYIGKNLKYPSQARRMGVEGKVYIQFVVEKDGSITDIKILKGIGSGCDEEAIRVLKNAPKWKPGKQRGVPVRVRRSIPIVFKLQ